MGYYLAFLITVWAAAMTLPLIPPNYDYEVTCIIGNHQAPLTQASVHDFGAGYVMLCDDHYALISSRYAKDIK